MQQQQQQLQQQQQQQHQQQMAQQGNNPGQHPINPQGPGLNMQAQLTALHAQQAHAQQSAAVQAAQAQAQAQQGGPGQPQQQQQQPQAQQPQQPPQQQPGPPQQPNQQQPQAQPGPGVNGPAQNQGPAQGPTPQPNAQQQVSPQTPQTTQAQQQQQHQLAQVQAAANVAMLQQHQQQKRVDSANLKGQCLLKLNLFNEHLNGFTVSLCSQSISLFTARSILTNTAQIRVPRVQTAWSTGTILSSGSSPQKVSSARLLRRVKMKLPILSPTRSTTQLCRDSSTCSSRVVYQKCSWSCRGRQTGRCPMTATSLRSPRRASFTGLTRDRTSSTTVSSVSSSIASRTSSFSTLLLRTMKSTIRGARSSKLLGPRICGSRSGGP